MKRKVAVTAAFVALGGLSMAAEPEDYLLETASDLAALCSAPADASAIHMCQGFMVGVHRAFETVGQALEDPLYCLPADGSASRDSAAMEFAAWAAANPEVASMSPGDGLLRWARTTYPCS